MFLPEQIANAKFTPISTGTYSAEEVDAFLSKVASDYQSLINDRDDLRKKLAFLAEKVESYRNDEDAIKTALLDAHKMADKVSKEASEKAESLVSQAQTRAGQIDDEAQRQANECTNAARNQAAEIVTNARNAVASIKERAQQEADRTLAGAKSSSTVSSAAGTSASSATGSATGTTGAGCSVTAAKSGTVGSLREGTSSGFI